jgi:hypothetical protein
MNKAKSGIFGWKASPPHLLQRIAQVPRFFLLRLVVLIRASWNSNCSSTIKGDELASHSSENEKAKCDSGLLYGSIMRVK